MMIQRRSIGGVGAAILIAAVGILVLIWRPWSAKLGLFEDGAANEKLWDAVSCRAQLYVQKAKGEVTDVSWGELWGLTLPGRGFACTEGSSLESRVQFSTEASEADREAGGRIFHERCSACHGINGSGGPFAPSLTRRQYNHGDSDFIIYKVLRDGVPGTAMQSVNLSLLERLQIVSYLRELQN
jgi:mono/diheme cytochrome c family protein